MLETMTDTAFAHQVGIAFATVWFIDKLKSAPWFPWLRENTDTLNRIVSIIAALATATGMKFVMDGNLAQGGTLLITFPSVVVIIDTAVHFLAQIGMQETIYKASKKCQPKEEPIE